MWDRRPDYICILIAYGVIKYVGKKTIHNAVGRALDTAIVHQASLISHHQGRS